MKQRRLFVSRMDIGQMLASSTTGSVTLSLECWRYTLTIYNGTSRNIFVNGVNIGEMIASVNSGSLPATYEERVGGASDRVNDVKEQIIMSAEPGRQCFGTLVVERWMETE